MKKPKFTDKISQKYNIDNVKLPLPAKILAILCIVQCVFSAPIAYNYISEFFWSIVNQDILEKTASSIIMTIFFLICLIATIALLIAIGVNMLLNKRRVAAVLSNIATITVIICSFTEIMVKGLSPEIYVQIITIVLTIALKSYLDPTLSKERKAQRKKRDENNKKEQASGSLGFHKDGRPKLNFFNLFWLFVIMCVVGYLWEIVWHMTVDNPGVYEERAGFIFGPFSPIYGFGACLITVILNKLSNKNFILIFFISALLGGFFEFFASLYLETCFGIRSWDYSHLPLNIDGRVSIRFFIIWGIIGLIWIKLLMKPLVKLINKIPWKLRYSLTIIGTAFMLVNMVMTFNALDCWYARNAGQPPVTPLEQFYEKNFNDDFMHQRFENMKMNPSSAIRGTKN